FWVSDGLNINTFTIAATAIQTGLSWWAAWLAIIIGYVFVSFLVTATARMGAIYHCSFPVLARASFGVYGALWSVLNRAIMACIWYGVQAYFGGDCVTIVLRALAPSYNDIPNGLPASAGTTTRDFLSFFLFSLISLPLVYLKPEKVRIFFNVKSVVVPIAAIAFFAWSIADAKGLGPIVRQKATISGSVWGWAFVSSIMSCISNMATLVLNIPDMSRLAKSSKNTTWPQIISIPATFGITSFLGIIISSSSTVIYGEQIWNPLDLLKRRLDLAPNDPGTRAGVFFIAAAFILGQIGTNIAANSLSAGHDLSALLPRYITIRRGGFICAAVGFAMCPWHITADSSSFATYLSAYSLFLSSISGTMLCDYYVVRRGLLDVPSLFSSASPSNNDSSAKQEPCEYRYTGGFNLRAFAAYLAGIAISVTGFAGVLGANVSLAAERIYILAYPIGFLVSALVYLGLCSVWPVQGGVDIREKGFLEPSSWEAEEWDGIARDVETAQTSSTSSVEKGNPSATSPDAKPSSRAVQEIHETDYHYSR
ncbi:hypothetical protein IE53DRAFT_391311, partial [Violaceomyces palustris]